VGWLSGETITAPARTLRDVEEHLLERAREAALSEPEQEEEGEENPCWWMLSALDFCEGKEAREAYYARLP
jgi:hypothetical protein